MLMDSAFIFTLFILGAALLFLWVKLVQARRAEFIRDYPLPVGLFDKLRQKRPELTLKDCQLVAHALRQFFIVYLKSNRQYVSMPSQVVDDLWHEFILYTRAYQSFCRRAFGTFFHHTPAVVLSNGRQRSNEGLRRCWWYACREEDINPRKPTRLPLLFAIDRKLGIADGFVYYPNCSRQRDDSAGGGGSTHCGGDFSDSSYDGSTSGFGDAAADAGGAGGAGDGGGCSGGCGGGD
jgi:hypothetical protein